MTVSHGKCQERASQFSRDTGNEEVNVRPGNDDEDELIDENHVYTRQNFSNNDNNQPSPTTSRRKVLSFINVHFLFPETHSMSNVAEPVLDFSSVSVYKHAGNATKCMASEYNDLMGDEIGNMAQVNQNKNNIEKTARCFLRNQNFSLTCRS